MHGRRDRGLVVGRWDEQHARRVLEAWRRSGQSAYAFSREQGIDPQRLYWWRKRHACTQIAHA